MSHPSMAISPDKCIEETRKRGRDTYDTDDLADDRPHPKRTKNEATRVTLEQQEPILIQPLVSGSQEFQSRPLIASNSPSRPINDILPPDHDSMETLIAETQVSHTDKSAVNQEGTAGGSYIQQQQLPSSLRHLPRSFHNRTRRDQELMPPALSNLFTIHHAQLSDRKLLHAIASMVDEGESAGGSYVQRESLSSPAALPPSLPSLPQKVGTRVTVICAECKRLKLRCDRRTPWAKCVHRGTTDMCIYSSAVGEKIDVHAVHQAQLSDRKLLHAIADAMGISRAERNTVVVEDIGNEIVFDNPLQPFDTRGNFCDPFLGTHRRAGKVVLKHLRHRGGGDEDVETLTRHFQRETTIWMGLRHDRILRCLGTFTRERHLYLVSPFMKNGTLFDWLRTGRHEGDSRLRLIYQLAEALVYLHSSGIVHGDVKANNVLLSDNFEVQLCDFGLTKLAESSTTTTLEGAGSIRWQSPELLNNEPKTFRSDVYAFAMTIVEILTGEIPFAKITHDPAVITAVLLRSERPPRAPEQSPDATSYGTAWDVVEQCWNQDADQRISMEMAAELLNCSI